MLLLYYYNVTRFLLASWWFFMLLVITVYGSSLTAFLTVSDLGVPLSGVLGLLDQGQLEWGVLEHASPETLLLTHRDPRYGELVRGGRAVTTFEAGLNHVREGQFVFIDEAPILKHNLREDCKYIFPVGAEFQSFEYAFGLRKESPYTELVDAYLLRYTNCWVEA